MKLFAASIKFGRSFLLDAVGIKRQLLKKNLCGFLFVVVLVFYTIRRLSTHHRDNSLHLNAPNVCGNLCWERKSKIFHAVPILVTGQTKIQIYPFSKFGAFTILIKRLKGVSITNAS